VLPSALVQIPSGINVALEITKPRGNRRIKGKWVVRYELVAAAAVAAAEVDECVLIAVSKNFEF